MLDHHLRLAGYQAHRLHIVVAIPRILVGQVLGQAHTGLGGAFAALAFVDYGIGMDEVVSFGPTLQDADAHLEKFSSGAGFVVTDGGEFLDRTGSATGGGDGDLAVLPDEVMHRRRGAGEPVLAK